MANLISSTATVGFGSDTLVLKVSQDAYKGDAQFTVSVDGTQIGGTFTARASHAAGKSDTLTVKGDWGVGTHAVSIDFLNDAYRGTAATDRNLYLDGAIYNGAAVGGAKLALMSGGPQGFNVPDATPVPSSTTVTRTEDFIQSIGVNTHMGNAASGYGDVQLVLEQLNYLGVDHIRDWIPEEIWPLQFSQLNTLASSGIKLNALVPNINPVDLDAHMAALDAFARAHPGAITSVEGPNEIDLSPIIYHGLEGVAAAQALQKDLYAAVHGNPVFAGVPVYNFTLGWSPPGSYGVGDMSAYADYGNVHGYVPNGMRPSDWLPNTIQAFSSNVPGKPTVVTETNYYTLPQDSNWGGVNQDVQAKYGLYTALANWKNGISATYFYELQDEAADLEREHNLGLFLADGTPKEFATALHNMTTILSDPGLNASLFHPSPVNVSFSGLPGTASSLVMEKSDGTYDVVVWDEQELWDPINHVQLPATSSDVTLSFERTFSSIQVFDPLEGISPIATYHGVDQIVLHLSDEPLIVQVI